MVLGVQGEEELEDWETQLLYERILTQNSLRLLPFRRRDIISLYLSFETVKNTWNKKFRLFTRHITKK